MLLENSVLRRIFECTNQKTRNLISRDQITRNELGRMSSVGLRDEG
jgi:hypothetical protein